MPHDATDILVLKALLPLAMAELGARFRVHRLDAAPDRHALLADVGPRIRGVVVAAQAPMDRALFARLPNLRIVANLGVGYDSIDAVEAAKRGIIITNTPDVLTEEVADLTIGLLLATLRQIPQMDRFLRAGHWPKGPYPLTATLRQRTVGIVGLGRIGRAIARRLAGFECSIAYHGRRRQTDVSYAYHDTLLGLAEAAHVLIVVAPASEGTRHIIDASVLKALGPDGFVINVARGSLIDEEALIAALQTGTIAGAGLDVFAGEPHVSPDLVALENVVLLPHVGSATSATRKEMADLVIANLVSWFGGDGPVTPVVETPWRPAPKTEPALNLTINASGVS